MKKGNIAIALVLLSFVTVIGFSVRKTRATAFTDISMQIGLYNRAYKLGEIVPLEIRITNDSSEVLYLPDETVEGIEIDISGKDGNYAKYAGPGRGFTIDGMGAPIIINPHQTLMLQKTILWNFKPDVSHLNSDAAKPILEGRILTDFGFSQAGNYLIRSSLAIRGEKPARIESEPVKITITEPTGEDLDIWSKIKDDGNIAYFMQEGDFRIPPYKTEERIKFQKEVEQILTDHPNSFYAESLRQSFDKFQVSEAKRLEAAQKVQMPNKKPQ